MSYLETLEAELAGVEPSDCIYPEATGTVYLTGVTNPLTRAAQRPSLGLLVQPLSGAHRDIEHYPYFAADNGCFAEAQGKPWDEDRWLRWLVTEVSPRADTCLFAVAPDVVGDAAATLARSPRYLRVIRQLGLPAAFVAQDGLENHTVPWGSSDALFIGGSTEWKLSDHAANLAAEASRRGLWVHMGRVNSWRRLEIAQRFGCDSADGTYLAFGPTKNWGNFTGWLDRLELAA